MPYGPTSERHGCLTSVSGSCRAGSKDTLREGGVKQAVLRVGGDMHEAGSTMDVLTALYPKVTGEAT